MLRTADEHKASTDVAISGGFCISGVLTCMVENEWQQLGGAEATRGCNDEPSNSACHQYNNEGAATLQVALALRDVEHILVCK